jgi:hypothetical protein
MGMSIEINQSKLLLVGARVAAWPSLFKPPAILFRAILTERRKQAGA